MLADVQLHCEDTDHCGVQERGDVEDLVQSQCRVDASVVFASAKKTETRVSPCLLHVFSVQVRGV